VEKNPKKPPINYNLKMTNMTKKITFLLMLFLVSSFSVYSQIQIGNETTNGKTPFYAPFGYSYSQSIYLASEINASGTINTIQWYYSGSGNLANSQQLVVYIGHTTKSVFASTADWEPIANLTQVYAGGITTNSAPGWKTLVLDTHFAYNGTSNLIIAVDENQEVSDNYDEQFYNTTVEGLRSIYKYTDYPDINPTLPPMANSIVNYVPNVILGGITQACPTPINIAVSNISSSVATVTWPNTNPLGGSDYYLSDLATAPTASTNPTGSVEPGIATFDASNLDPQTIYYLWVRNKCSSELQSNWSSAVSFTTNCAPVDTFFEDFEDATIPELPSCWYKILRGGADLSPIAAIKTSENGLMNGEKNAYLFSGDSNSSNETNADIILVAPEVTNLNSGLYRLRFKARRNAIVGTLQIGTLNNTSNMATFTILTSEGITQTTSEYLIDFSSYAGTDTFIGFRIVPNSQGMLMSEISIDDIAWELAPNCPDTTGLNLVGTTPNTATVAWDLTDTNQYQIVYGPETTTDPNELTPSEPTTFLSQEIEGLNPDTTYKVWVRSVCESENSAWNNPITFTTPCLPLAVGIYENFNQTTNTELPNCWSKIIRGNTVSEFAWVQTDEYSDLFPSPNTVVSLYNDGSASTDDIILVSPSLSTVPLATHRLKFHAKHGYDPASIQIGTLNGNNNAAPFTLFQNVVLSDQTAQYVVEFNSYSGTDTYIGFRLNPTDDYDSVFIDNILWEIIPTCPDVTLINVPSTVPDGATINWTIGGGEDSWDVAIGAAAASDPVLLPFTNFEHAPVNNTVTVNVSDLSDNTNYNVWVRSVCAGNDKGAWIGPISFKTACLAVTAFDETFQNAITPELPSCWNSILTGDSLSEYAEIYTQEGSYMPTETKAVVMKNSDSGEDAQIILVSPSVSNLSLGTYRLKFVAKSGEPGSLEIGTLSSGTDLAIFSPLMTVSTTPIPTEYIVDFNGYSGTDTYIGIRLNKIIQYQYIELDNIVWEPIPLCPDVTLLEKTATTMTTTTASWNANNADLWEVVIGDTADTDPNTLEATEESGTEHIFENLTAGTSYNVWVRAICEASLGNGAWEGPLLITTQCEATSVPYIQDFETAITPGLPDCTSALNLADAPSNWYTHHYPGNGFESGTLTYLGDNFTDANAWFFTRAINLTAGQNYTVSFRFGGAQITEFDLYLNKLKVMYGTDASQGGMTLPIAEYFDEWDAPQAQTITITPPTTGVYYFGFNVLSPNNSYYMFVDDIVIDIDLANPGFDSTQFNYYPNPVKDILNISYINDISSVAIYNILGQEVLTKSVNDNLAKIDMSFLSQGTYLVKVASGNLIKNIKVIKS